MPWQAQQSCIHNPAQPAAVTASTACLGRQCWRPMYQQILRYRLHPFTMMFRVSDGLVRLHRGLQRALMDLNGFKWILVFVLTCRWDPPDLELIDLGVMIPIWNQSASSRWAEDRGPRTSALPAVHGGQRCSRPANHRHPHSGPQTSAPPMVHSRASLR